jgi:hypothetical protein
MAGLLDFFENGSADTMGLLGVSPEDIQKRQNSAQADALFALAGSLFKGGKVAPSILQGLQQGSQAYQGAMQAGLQQQLQNAQLQEMLKKRQQEQQTLAEQKRVQNIVQGAYSPDTFAETPLTNMFGQEVAGPNQPQAAGGGLKAVQRELMALGPAGMTALQTASGVEKALRPEGYTLGEGQIRYEIGADGKPVSVAQGAPKDNLTSNYRDFQQAVNQGYKGNFLEYQKELKREGAPKVSVDLNDQTAVAKQKLATINQWQGTLKDTGDTTVAGRASAFYDAYGKAKQGNTSADGALIYNIAKVYDQTGAVQQGDVNTIIGNRSIPTNIQLFAEKLAKGGTFTPKERDNLKLIVDGIVSERKKALEPTINVYRGLNSTLGGKPEEIINPYDTIKTPDLLPSGVTVKKKG